MSVCLFIDNYSKMLAEATGQISPQVLYPTIQGACLICVNVLAALAFREKPTAKTYIGTAIAIGGIVVMSIAG
jgi:multidrug transporter EmrE-like cation transporter